jgi:hypothetical protein
MTLDVFQRDAGWRNLDDRQLVAAAAARRLIAKAQIVGGDRAALGEQDRALDRVLELANVDRASCSASAASARRARGRRPSSSDRPRSGE